MNCWLSSCRCLSVLGAISIFTALNLVPLSAVGAGPDQQKAELWLEDYDAKVLPIFRDKCFSCHEGQESDGGLDLAGIADGKTALAKIDVWDRVGKRVRLKEMPPEGSPQLNDQQKSVVHRWLDSKPESNDCAKLASDDTKSWYRGVVMSRRLTRTEYLNTIRFLTGVSVDDQFSLPSDGSGGEGFDTNGDSLFTSPIHVEQYLAIADDLVHRMIDGRAAGLNRMFPDSSPEDLAQLLQRRRDAKSRSVSRLALARFARLAFRRRVTEREVDQLMGLFDRHWRASATVAESLVDPLKAVLISPRFLFVVEPEQEGGGVQRLTPHQLATRLALYLWSSGPDGWLLDLADAGELDRDDQVATVAMQMLKDPKADAIGQNFGLQWLGLTDLQETRIPDADVFPEFTPELARDFRGEAARTVARVFRDNRPLTELIETDVVVVNQRLADFYGIEKTTTSPWQTVDVSGLPRGGVLTMGATLLKTSYPRRTSPVLRGQWVLEHLLGSPVPPPPPGVPALDDHDESDAVSFRQQLERHRADPKCASCHNRMDPLGFGLERFDAIGRLRVDDAGKSIDSSGRLPSGETFEGAAGLKQVLLARRSEFEKNLVRRMLGFALGRELNKFDECVIDDCLKAMQKDQGRASALIKTIVTSYPFQNRFYAAK